MQIDFHHSVTYVVARLAGFNHDEAAISRDSPLEKLRQRPPIPKRVGIAPQARSRLRSQIGNNSDSICPQGL
jgi:hypothetical protein